MNFNRKIIIFILLFLGFNHQVFAVDYSISTSAGVITSINLLPKSEPLVNVMESFDYTVSALPTGTSLAVQFSSDFLNWYSADGVINTFTSMSLGSNSIDLSFFDRQNYFYYRILFVSTSTGTPVLNEVNLNYDSVAPDYEIEMSSAFMTSSDLLLGLASSTITNFSYNISSLPSGSSLSIQFSLNNTDWYSAGGEANVFTPMLLGINNIDLSGLSWEGEHFYYRILFISTDENSPVLDEINLNGLITQVGGDFIASTVGRHIQNIDVGTTTSIKLDGAFVFYRESGTDTVNEITITQLGTLDPEYIDNVKLNYVLKSGTSTAFCPDNYDDGEPFDDDFGGTIDLDILSGAATFSKEGGVEIPEENVLCLYPEYSISADLVPLENVGKTIKLGIATTSDIVLEDAETVVDFSGESLSIWGSTVLAQEGVSTITFVSTDPDTQEQIEKVFYVEDGVLYLQIDDEEPRRLTSRDVRVQNVNFRDLTPVGSDQGQIEVILRLEYAGPNYVGAPVVQTFKTTINTSY